MKWTDYALLFSTRFRELVRDDAIGFIDCGARDDVPEPWLSLEKMHPDLLSVLGFEADAEEAAKLNKMLGGSRTYIPAAAWKERGCRKLYLTDPPATSSLFPPNECLTDFFGPGVTKSVPDGRKLRRIVDVPTTTLDDAVRESNFRADFLKIDTQGAEYEILEGAPGLLRTDLFGVVAETWTLEVYKGTRPTWDVMALMASHGFMFVTHHVAGLVQRNFVDASTRGFVQKHQIASLELLFFREPEAFVKNARAPSQVYKAVAIADVYGFADIGVALLRFAVMRWPSELKNVQECYNEMKLRRSSLPVHPDRLYPSIRGSAPIRA